MWNQNIDSELSQILKSINKNQNKIPIGNLKNEKRIMLYGAGIDGIRVLNELEKDSIDVIAFLDIRADLIGNIRKIPVYKPDFDGFNTEVKEEATIILTVKPYAPRTRDIINNLKSYGYKNIIMATDIFEFYSFTQEDVINYNDLIKNIVHCANLFEDEISYQVYKGFITSHATGEYETFYEPNDKIKYFDQDLKFKKGFQRFIDCGAYNGDTLEDLNILKGKVEKIALFEPDMKTFKQLLTRISSNKNNFADEMFVYPCGVWSKTEKLNANLGMGLNTHISEDGQDIIQCIALDEVLVGFKPTFIKMDVEGAEQQALLGAKQTISEYKPDLAISAYHCLKDIWEIPLLINGWNLGYKFYLRAYGQGGNATMLYAFAD